MGIELKNIKKQGFTLVELSIVIVIIGFLVAGIAAGSSMIKQAQIRSVISDFQSYETAFNNFKAKYGGVPGDISKASSYWPNAGQCTDTLLNLPLCNGNDDGYIEYDDGSGKTEVAYTLKHLSLAGMINSLIPAITATPDPLIPGSNAPASKISGAGYFFIYYPTIKENVAVLGKPIQVVLPDPDVFQVLTDGAMTPEDAFSIDQKIDDGIITGGVFTGSFSGKFYTLDGSDVTNPDDCADNTLNTYNITTTYTACIISKKLP